jgi:formiminotetrahydrofolate cyclodeaminase
MNMTLMDKSARDLLSAFSSSDPTPGGGSASALASAVGASLLLMVASLPKTRANSAEDRTALDRAASGLGGVRTQLADAVDADSAAYDEVVAAYRLPKGTAEEQTARKLAIQRALRSAIEVPLGVMKLSNQAMQHAAEIAAHGHRAASSDVGVAVALLQAGASGARLNVDTNVQSVNDAAYLSGVRSEVAALANELSTAAEAATRTLTVR